MKTVLLIDGDVLVYQAGLRVETPIHWGEDQWSLHADANEAKQRLSDELQHWKQLLKADSIRVALSCTTDAGFRRQLNPLYKANRKDSRKPVCHVALREYLRSEWGAAMWPRLEADDILGIWATEPDTGEERIICSIDKDFRGVPGQVFNPRSLEVLPVSMEEALRFHAIQTLMGDAVDGYAGIPGVGIKTAEKLLDKSPELPLWDRVVAAYKARGLGEETALLNARMAHILQHGEYKQETHKITLWTPPSLTKTKTKKSASR